MRLVDKYSHMNGWEYLVVHRKALLQEIRDVIHNVDAWACRTKASNNTRATKRGPFSSKKITRSFIQEFSSRGWSKEIKILSDAPEETVMRLRKRRPYREQETIIGDTEYSPIWPLRKRDFVKERVAVEVQFRKYGSVAHELFVKHLGLFVSDMVDVGIGILPTEEMEGTTATGFPYYERARLELMRHARGSRAAPLVLLGVAP